MIGLMLFLGFVATACSFTGAFLICRQEEQDFAQREIAKRKAESQGD